MNSVCIKRTTCRYCNSSDLTMFLSLGKHPPSNSFISPTQIQNEQRFPLEVYLCQSCFLTQLVDVVSPELIFDNYLYLSSTSKALKNHYASLAQMLTKRFKLKAGDVVVDIGCNDGILLLGYSPINLIRIGVEPSNVAKIARDAGVEVYKNFFGQKVARRIVKKYGKAKLITATNVFAHIDKIGQFVLGIFPLLDDKGVFVIEASYVVDVIDQTLFDTIYHEHLCYLCLTPMVPFLARYNLEVFDVERVPFGASGPAFRVYIAKVGTRKIKKTVSQMISDEETWGVKKLTRYQEYSRKVETVKEKVLQFINKLQSKGVQLGGYGAPAKGNTLLNYFGITPQMIGYIADTNPLKQGLLTPGSHIPIVSEEDFIRIMPEYALLLSWNYLDFFLKNSEYIHRGGKFLVPIPVPKIVP